MRKCLVFNYCEIGLKKGNRKYFEEQFLLHLKKVALKWDLKEFKVYRGRFVLILKDDMDILGLSEDFKKVFGLSSIFVGYILERDFNVALKVSKLLLEGAKTFKVAAKRIDKSFSPNSMEINANFGGDILENIPNLSVDIKKPEVKLCFEVFPDFFLIFKHLTDANGGLPYGTAGTVVSMLSGGIDSPVATFMMMKRGCNVIPVHFHTPPYTGEGSLNKVKDLAKILAGYSFNGLKLHVVNMTELQVAIKKYAKSRYITILSRRIMARISMEIALKNNAQGIVTGEALSQVASQTLANLNCVNSIYSLPVLRPLIGFDKLEIIDKAQAIKTFDVSIINEVDCCSLFSPTRPETNGNVEIIEKEEAIVFEKIGNKFPYEVEIFSVD